MSTTSLQTENDFDVKNTNGKIVIPGVPSPKQKQFFNSRARFTAYGGARGGGKSWALRRKLVAMCLRYPTINCLLIRRTLPELKSNHILPFLREYKGLVQYSEADKVLKFQNGSKINLGFCDSDRDALRYQGQEYDVIAIDEATQLSEYRFLIFKACLRGTSDFPRRMYLTCNPGGIGHAWVKRLFVDRDFRHGENPNDYKFIQALVFDNSVLTSADPEYISSLKSLPDKMRRAWLYGEWDIFEGQFFPEFDARVHTCNPCVIPNLTSRFIAFDYGFDMLAALLMAIDSEGNLYAVRETCISGLTLTQAAKEIVALSSGQNVEFAVASPDLWNRRQDSGRCGFEIMQSVPGMPPLIAADDRRIPGWRVVREYLNPSDSTPNLKISYECPELIRCLPALMFDKNRPEDASGDPHSITHAPEALRYAVMSRLSPPVEKNDLAGFVFPSTTKKGFFD